MSENNVFSGIAFIKPDIENKNTAPMFRRKFFAPETKNAKLYFCPLGIGYCYINGKSVSADVLSPAISDYNKTLWYNEYDVSEILVPGENVINVWCGNGWYNESLKSAWNFNEATWRDVPKFILKLEADGKTIITSSDGDWRCLTDGPVYFNELRSGEYFDARKSDQSWLLSEFDDSIWEKAIEDKTPIKSVFRKTPCPGIREFEHYSAKYILQTGENGFVYDLGQNISGYVKVSVKKGKRDTLVTLRYSEQLKENGERELNRMNEMYPESEFQTDKLILSGEPFEWSPLFCYHGFRYIEVEGTENADDIAIEGIFVHQAVERKTTFTCSDEFLNKLFNAGIYSTWSNMFNMITDCPTREKLGWANDAQSSCEQILTDFKAESLLEKWLTDVFDAMREDGSLPGIIPTAGWGYQWGNGPVSDGLLFEIPYRIYLHTGQKELLEKAMPYFDRYFDYLKTKADPDGYVRFGLDDWAAPRKYAENEEHVPVEFINALLIRRFYEIASIAALSKEKYISEAEKLKKKIIGNFVKEDGTSSVNAQTAVAMLIYYDICEDNSALAKQLKTLIEKNNFHHNCGMVGMRRLYYALNKIGAEEYAYRIITASGYPGYRQWFDEGATTLWEFWDTELHADSKNHQMYSDFMSWMIKTIIGISAEDDAPGFTTVHLKPYFFKDISYAKGSCDTVSGRIAVEWKRLGENISLIVNVPDGIRVYYNGSKLHPGQNKIAIKN